MKIAVITFHAAHNFGSVLQAYALQTYIKKILPGATYEILNYRSKIQKELYAVLKKNNSIKSIIKNIVKLPHLADLNTKYDKFEKFIQEELHVTLEEINEEDSIPESWRNYDIYISGSDQLWNIRAKDFSDIYFLNFVDNVKKVSYAASFGPLEIDWKKYDISKYRGYISQYAKLSVRELGSLDNIRLLTDKACEIDVDPTMLLGVDEWRELQADINFNNGHYILLYCLEPTKQQLKIVRTISKILHLPIVTLKPANRNDMINDFVKKYDSGPKDFLAYIDHAALVVTSSFHGTVFSLIYNKPFYVLNGMKDKRINSLLSKMNIEDRSLETLEDISRVTLQNPDEMIISNCLNEERTKSDMYLRSVLEIE